MNQFYLHYGAKLNIKTPKSYYCQKYSVDKSILLSWKKYKQFRNNISLFKTSTYERLCCIYYNVGPEMTNKTKDDNFYHTADISVKNKNSAKISWMMLRHTRPL